MRTFFSRLAAAAMVGMLGLTFAAAPAHANSTLRVNLSIEADGSAPFDADDMPGHDSGPNNGIVKTNDSVVYRIDWAVGDGAASGLTITATLPVEGASWWDMPPGCDPLASAWLDDYRTIRCRLADVATGTTGTLYAWAAFPTMPNGTVVSLSVTFADDAGGTVTSNAVSVRLSAAPRINLVKNLAAVQEEVTDGGGVPGFVFFWSIIAAVDNTDIVGAESLSTTTPLTFTDDLTGITPNTRLVDFPLTGNQYDGTTCGPTDLSASYAPYGRSTMPAADPYNSAPDSGTWTCTTTPGQQINVSVTGADAAGSIAMRGANGQWIGPYRALLSGQIATFTPRQDVIDVVGAAGSLNITNRVANLVANGASGAPNYSGAPEPLGDNARTQTIFLTTPPPGGRYAFFGDFRNAPVSLGEGPGNYDCCYPYWDFMGWNNYPGRPLSDRWNLPTQSGNHSGDARILPSSRLDYTLSATGSDYAAYNVFCTRWDPNELHLVANPTITINTRNGWGQIESTRTIPRDTPYAHHLIANIPAPGSDYEIHGGLYGTMYVTEYGSGGYASDAAQIAANCNDASSPDGWVSDPALLPGGVGSATKARTFFYNPTGASAVGRNIIFTFETAATIVPGQIVSVATGGAQVDLAGAGWTGTAPWERDWYDASLHNAWEGDRAFGASMIMGIDKRSPLDGSSVLPGQVLDFTVEVAVSGQSEGTQITDTLPAQLSYVPGSASIAPASAPAGPGGVLTWDFGTVRDTSVTVTYQATVSPSVTPWQSISTTARASATNLQQVVAPLADTVRMWVPGEMQRFVVTKAAADPLVDPDTPIEFTLNYANAGTLDLGDVDLIDILPHNGDSAARTTPTNYTGSLSFSSVTGTAGETFTVTAAPPVSISTDPLDPSNQPAGSTVWCALADLGNPGCPASLAEITAVRAVAAGPLSVGENHDLTLTLTPTGNRVLDVYANDYGARVGGTDYHITSNDVTVTVTGPPAAEPDTATTPQNTAITIAVLTNDRAGDPTYPLDTSTVALLDPADNTYKTTVTIPNQGTYTANPDGTVTFTPDATYTGTTTPLEYRITDGADRAATATITITVTASPPAPAPEPPAPTPTPEPAPAPQPSPTQPASQPDESSGLQGNPVTLNPLTNDTPAASPLDPTTVQLLDPADNTYKAIVTIPNQGTFTVNTATGIVTFTPTSAYVGTATIAYRVNTVAGETLINTITITITPNTFPIRPSGPLAYTGANVRTQLIYAGLLIMLGLIAAAAARRRVRLSR